MSQAALAPNSFDRSGNGPQQGSRSRGLQANIPVCSRLVAERVHRLLAVLTKYDDRLFVAAPTSHRIEKVKCVETIFVADKNDVKILVAESGKTFHHSGGFCEYDFARGIRSKRIRQPTTRTNRSGDEQGTDLYRQMTARRRQTFFRS